MGRAASVIEGGLATQRAIVEEETGLNLGSRKAWRRRLLLHALLRIAPLGLLWLGGFALLAVAFYAAIALLQPIVAAVAGAGALALLRWARAERPVSPALVAFDAAAFAIFAI